MFGQVNGFMQMSLQIWKILYGKRYSISLVAIFNCQVVNTYIVNEQVQEWLNQFRAHTNTVG